MNAETEMVRGFCGECRFWAHPDSLRNQQLMAQGFGECRRRAPAGMTLSFEVRDANAAMGVVYPFPPVPPSDWCGESAPAPHSQEPAR